MSISYFGNREPMPLVDICSFDLISEVIKHLTNPEIFAILNALAGAGKWDAAMWAMYNWVRNDSESRMLIPQPGDVHPALTAECPAENLSFSIEAPYAELETISGFYEIVGEESTFMRLGESVQLKVS
ncbi:hypothetical protein PAB09_05550 [Corynebacterium sp. SCR221107]|uniref:hypothetical protein n=1 Tax=Corynebacterium sp. SCR221107 TaxID=3017361 RepID=UPI0022EC3B6F|nr:hypothetical protein [Corynebacterium sp. SCR221107]WBT09759.1 hypothetical protein PAB09_05550 [Corynebacterium sp. SCR221107]